MQLADDVGLVVGTTLVGGGVKVLEKEVDGQKKRRRKRRKKVAVK